MNDVTMKRPLSTIKKATLLLLIISTNVSSSYAGTTVAQKHHNLKQEPVSEQKTTINETKYLHAFNVFLANGNVKAAFAIAEKFVKLHPADLEWRKRYIRTALWSEQPYLAFKQLTYLAQHQQGKVEDAVKLGYELNAYHDLIPLLQTQLKAKPHDPEIVTKLAESYENDGQVDHAVALLYRELKQNENKKYWVMLADIYKKKGDTKNELKTLEILEHRYGLTANNAKRRAQISYNLGKVANSKNILLQLANKEPINDENYWKQLGDLAWLTTDNKTIALAYNKSHELNTSSQESLRRLIILLQGTHPQQALQLALYGWRHYHDLDFFMLALPMALQPQNKNILNELYSTLTPAQSGYLQQQSGYWYGKSLLRQRFHGAKAARQLLLQNIAQNSNLDAVKPAYLQLLNEQLSHDINQQDEGALASTLQSWSAQIPQNPALWGPFQQGYLLLDKPLYAFALNQPYAERMRYHYLWDTQYADILEKLELDNQAYETRAYAWALVSQQLATDNSCSIPLQTGFTELAGYFCGGNVSYGALANATATTHISPDSLLSWAIQNGNDDLARYLINYYYFNDAPAWAVLKLAMLDNNKAKIRKTLSNMKEVLPPMDRVSAAQQIDDLPLAQRLAYQGVESKPTDSGRYQQMTEVMLENANQFGIMQEYEQFGNLTGPRSKIDAKLFLTPQFSIAPFSSIWFTSSKNSDTINSPPSYDEFSGLIFGHKTTVNDLSITLGQRKDLYQFFTALFSDNYKVNTPTIVGLKLGLNQRSTLNELMLAGGMQDEVSGSLSYQLTARDTLIGKLEWDRYFTQNRNSLGNGYILSGAYSHKFWFSYPDYTLNLFGSADQFTKDSKRISGRILNLIPNNEIPSVSLFIPSNFWQMGIGFSFGGDVKTNYNHAWRPYASINLLYTSTGGIGDVVDAGLAGSVIGRDKLMFYVAQSTNQQAATQNNFLVGARYRIYF